MIKLALGSFLLFLIRFLTTNTTKKKKKIKEGKRPHGIWLLHMGFPWQAEELVAIVAITACQCVCAQHHDTKAKAGHLTEI